MIKAVVSTLLALTLMASQSRAQNPAEAPTRTYEAASIRPAHLEPGCFSISPPGTAQFAATCVDLRTLIAMAWKIHPDSIQNGDAASLATFYNLRVAAPEARTWTGDTIPPMLRQLLAERFHLKTHPGTKQVSGYALVIARAGSKLKPADFDVAQQGIKAGQAFANYIVPGEVHARGADLPLIAGLLSSPAHATVLDRTSIPGVFNMDLHYAFEGATEQNLPDFFTAVEEQLGLKLQAEKLTVDTLVIDHVDNEPTPN